MRTCLDTYFCAHGGACEHGYSWWCPHLSDGLRALCTVLYQARRAIERAAGVGR